MSQPCDIADRIRSNWLSVTDQVRRSALQAGRDPSSIRVIGVSKYVDEIQTKMLVDAGCRDLGESRPQLLWHKADYLGETVEGDSVGGAKIDQPRWHMIGHVQTNKLRRLLRYGPLIHSVDSERLLRAIDQEASRQGRIAEVLLEINISGDENKTGLSPVGVRQLLEITDLSCVRIQGLMAMAGWGTQSQDAALQFGRVAELRDSLVQTTGHPLEELSMGMSGDFVEAIAAGSTMVRIGSALFEGVI